nr:AraC family transcriptional regulator [Nocardia bovistercoris]
MSRVLSEIRFHSAGYRRLRLGAPFEITFTQSGLRGIHIVLHGECDLVLTGDIRHRLRAGDLAILPRADPHALCSIGPPPLRPTSAAQLAALPDKSIHFGGSGAETSILCGAFAVGEPQHPALQGLPSVLHVRGERGAVPPWLHPYIDIVTAEVAEQAAGSDLVMARLSDAIVIRAMRHHGAVTDQPGWLAGLADPALARALAAIHDDPAHPWRIDTLAHLTGMSRATFAAKFTDRVGQPAITYITALRMQKARTLLRDDRLTVAAIARQVGYRSDVAFAAAFKRAHRMSPGRFRAHEQH